MKHIIAALLVLPLLLTAAPKKGSRDRLKGVFPENIKCVAVLTPASTPNEKGTRAVIAAMEKAGKDGVVLSFGSLYTIGDIRNALEEI